MNDKQLAKMSDQITMFGAMLGCDDMFQTDGWDRFAALTRDAMIEQGLDPHDRPTLERCLFGAFQALSVTYYSPGFMRGPCCGMLWAPAELYRRWLAGETPLVTDEQMAKLPAV